VKGFQNINPNKEGKMINAPVDLKNEIKIIMLPEKKWKLWKDFLTK